MRKKRLPMGGLEDAVMEVLWNDNGWMTPGEIHAQLESARPLAYTTVTTVLMRLWDKERLERRRDGRAYAYHPTSSRAEWAAQRMGEFLVTVSDRKTALSHFLEGLDTADRTQLRRMLSEKRPR